MNLSDSVLIESSSAREQGLSVIEAQNLQFRLLRKVKDVFFALWRGSGYITTKQVADYYQVSEKTISKNLQRNRDEFKSDGAVLVTGDDLKDARDIMSLASRASHINLFTPRAVIRMGFILEESEVAVQVRTTALNVIQGIGDLVSSEEILANLMSSKSPYESFIDNLQLKVSSPLADYYDVIAKDLKRLYPDGGIPGLTKQDIRERLAALSTYTQSWKLSTQKELKFNLRSSTRAKCPDLVSDPIPVNVDGEDRKAVFMFQIENLLVEPENIEECIGRQYIKRAKNEMGVDYAYIFLVAPFGATPDAQAYIQNDLPTEMKGFVGAITVQDLAVFLRKQAGSERMTNIVKGQITTQFEQLLKYRIPTDPLSVLFGMTF